ncbi:hit family protein 1 [Punctularia strigosozonata HHB-11173 SS5]|uniref:hit family protein 1 n=1 Tax=Punctularia strigosozonata (strain HHB-11173) TaxID=741275 RepID=UPI000441663B|nr:hit family protein 1 [Punctularia strigosozonata HHB-11173 SS5]EIN06877.1 hit family protein 1 [Punctularia strigosozonata HHB-11173 SS5]
MAGARHSCLFCRIIQGTLPCAKLLETDKTLVFLDIGPVSEGHALIIPKFHGQKMHDVPDDYLQEILPIAKKVALAIGADDYNILQNNGRLAFQHVMHVHFHVIPKYDKATGLVINEETWPRVEVGIDGLREIQQKITAKLEVKSEEEPSPE